jgi:hypothetical protein
MHPVFLPRFAGYGIHTSHVVIPAANASASERELEPGPSGRLPAYAGTSGANSFIRRADPHSPFRLLRTSALGMPAEPRIAVRG